MDRVSFLRLSVGKVHEKIVPRRVQDMIGSCTTPLIHRARIVPIVTNRVCPRPFQGREQPWRLPAAASEQPPPRQPWLLLSPLHAPLVVTTFQRKHCSYFGGIHAPPT